MSPQPFAPGTAIFVGDRKERCGVACFVGHGDDYYLLTCGHVFQPHEERVAVWKSDVDRTEKKVAELEKSFYDDPAPLDAALCRLTREGQTMAENALSESGWYEDVATPQQSDSGEVASLWSTCNDAADRHDAEFLDYPVSTSDLVSPHWVVRTLAGLIMTEVVAQPGDSGSLLSLREQYLGICSGSYGDYSFFTPIIDAIERVGDHLGGKVDLCC